MAKITEEQKHEVIRQAREAYEHGDVIVEKNAKVQRRQFQNDGYWVQAWVCVPQEKRLS